MICCFSCATRSSVRTVIAIPFWPPHGIYVPLAGIYVSTRRAYAEALLHRREPAGHAPVNELVPHAHDHTAQNGRVNPVGEIEGSPYWMMSFDSSSLRCVSVNAIALTTSTGTGPSAAWLIRRRRPSTTSTIAPRSSCCIMTQSRLRTDASASDGTTPSRRRWRSANSTAGFCSRLNKPGQQPARLPPLPAPLPSARTPLEEGRHVALNTALALMAWLRPARRGTCHELPLRVGVNCLTQHALGSQHREAGDLALHLGEDMRPFLDRLLARLLADRLRVSLGLGLEVVAGLLADLRRLGDDLLRLALRFGDGAIVFLLPLAAASRAVSTSAMLRAIRSLRSFSIRVTGLYTTDRARSSTG